MESRSRHLIDPEVDRALDIFPTTDLDEVALKEARLSQAQMLPQVDITELFPVTFEERAVASYFEGPDVRIEIIKPKQSTRKIASVLFYARRWYGYGKSCW